MRTAIIVPARLASQRFPRKLLHPIQGKPLILWTAERIQAVASDVPLYFAVGDEELSAVLGSAGFEAIMTDPNLPSGTDRLAVANEQVRAEIVVNVQADEPLISAVHIGQLIELMQGGADMATLAVPFTNIEDFADPNKVKVVSGEQGRALYFTRGEAPFNRDTAGKVDSAWLQTAPVHWHMGLYAYTGAFLKEFRCLKPGTLEQIEKLEQLRAMENGYTIQVGITNDRTVGIDVPEDIAAFKQALGSP